MSSFSWQHIFSDDALHRAWQTVRAKQSAGGADGQTIAQFAQNLKSNLSCLQTELIQESYRPHKVTQVLVPKPNGDWRPLTIWSLRDRIAQRATYNYLMSLFDPQFLDCSFGYRPGRTPKQAAQAIQQAGRMGNQWVLDGDIKDCFAQMKTHILLGRLAEWRTPDPLIRLIKLWLEAKVWNGWQSKTAGTAQGGVISPLLCNLYLHTFDQTICRHRLKLVRYADDFIILAPSEGAVQQAKELAANNLQQLGLQLHPQKTWLTNFSAGFRFVGWFFIRNEMFYLR